MNADIKGAIKNCSTSMEFQQTQLKTKVMPHETPEKSYCIRDIIKLSIKKSTVTSNLKKTLVSPLLKQSYLKLISKNYRLVLNLSYLSKLIEKTVYSQLTSYNNTTGKLSHYNLPTNGDIPPTAHSLK